MTEENSLTTVSLRVSDENSLLYDLGKSIGQIEGKEKHLQDKQAEILKILDEQKQELKELKRTADYVYGAFVGFIFLVVVTLVLCFIFKDEVVSVAAALFKGVIAVK